MSFDQAFALTVSPAVEGGFTAARSDPGNWTGGRVGAGELWGTNYGLSAAFLARLPAADPFCRKQPRTLTLDDARTIYRAQFWDPFQGDHLHGGVAGLLFDAEVNQGPGWTPRCLQSALGLATDGVIGPKTLAAALAADQATLHAEIARLRDARYRQDPDWNTFGVGWMRRLMRVVAATWGFA